jgi:hypothetical protein
MEEFLRVVVLPLALIVLTILISIWAHKDRKRIDKILKEPEFPKNAFETWTYAETYVAAYLAMYDCNRSSPLLIALADNIERTPGALYTKARKVFRTKSGARNHNIELSAYNCVYSFSKHKAESELVNVLKQISGDGNWLYDQGYFKKLF